MVTGFIPKYYATAQELVEASVEARKECAERNKKMKIAQEIACAIADGNAYVSVNNTKYIINNFEINYDESPLEVLIFPDITDEEHQSMRKRRLNSE